MITTNIKDVMKSFSEFEKTQIPYIQMLTANNIAFDTMKSARSNVRSRFRGKDLSKAISVKKATKDKPYAEVYVNDYIRWRENALVTLGLSGDRSRKSIEIAMNKAGLLRSSEILIEDGSVAPWVYVQLMSVLQLNWKAGYSANQTKASKKRKQSALKKASKSESKFFVVTTNHQAISRELGKVTRKRSMLAPGIYTRMADNVNKKEVFRLFKIGRKPIYSKQWDLEKIVKLVYDRRGGEHFSNAYDVAMLTARR